MSSQRFCLRWNNHQTNMLSVFDQLLHAETFTDVTLAVEGQYLKAHKMVLSACSPYFQAIFVGHQEKDPIVILKDVPYKDMKCLLDFMYRGEVSVDQDRLAAFLRVAESLRIKGLTEVNDDKPPPAAVNAAGTNQNQSQQQQNQQLQQQLAAAASRNTQLTTTSTRGGEQQQGQSKQKSAAGQSMLLTNPVLGNALSQQRRKRVRPRKLSGSDTGDGEYDGYESDGPQDSPELVMDVKMGGSDDENVISRSEENDHEDSMDASGSPPMVNNNNNSVNNKSASSKAPASSSISATGATNNNNSHAMNNAKSSASSLRNENSMSALADKPEITVIPQPPKPLPPTPNANANEQQQPDQQQSISLMETTEEPITTPGNDSADDEDQADSDSDLEFIVPPKSVGSDDCTIVENRQPLEREKLNGYQQQHESITRGPDQQQQQLFLQQLQQQHLQNLHLQNRSLEKMRMTQSGGDNTSDASLVLGSDPEDQEMGSPQGGLQDSYDEMNGHNSSGYAHSRQAPKRRVRRKNISPDDQAEALTEMSVRGLNLFRYASVSDGVYQCMECAKENVQKTFKNKYSFQRHAFLYHEGAQRKVFPCPVCNKEFSRPDKMKNHLKTTHESYMGKSADMGYPMSYLVGAATGAQEVPVGQIPPPTHATAKIESVLNAIQLQQHLQMQKELHNQQQQQVNRFQQMISPKLVENGTPAIAVVSNAGSQ
ncbi:protein tramtrack, alpha isoform-like isoform X2 [Uranotaenia lowii]|uniref:protein tramtrack, alpha isoform-like isoform X2 n=1 Tax=Uranotaenia lowii TaxID=190385 RepID=UPI00247A6A61|nr:protein tramtrack, alpha isoform-like isoform X2 [Uranotaenia lowii]